MFSLLPFTRNETACFYRRESTLLTDNTFSYVYIGNEFCERRLPSKELCEEVYRHCNVNGKKLVLVTSYCSSSGVDAIERLLKMCSQANVHFDEIVINDYGVLELLKQIEYETVRILGRLLTSRYYEDAKNNISSFFPDAFLSFLKANTITAVECNAHEHWMHVARQLETENMSAHLHYPYQYITTSRYCSTAKAYSGYLKDTQEMCNYECENIYGVLNNKYFGSRLHIEGNTYFCRQKTNQQSPNILKRLIYHE